MAHEIPNAASPEEEIVVARLVELGAEETAARKWYREGPPLPGFSGKNAYDLVRAGQLDRLLEEVDRIAMGGYA